MKQDRNGVRSAQDLEQKYDFLGMEKAVKQSETGITKINGELQEYAIAISELKSQVGGKTTAWFLSGIPTNENEPASKWTEEEKANHIGDLYYDKETGNAYVYIDNNGYTWEEITDSFTIEVLSIANAAKDTEDTSRQNFFEQPTTPYYIGDLWVDSEHLKRCIRTRDSGDFDDIDWVDAIYFTDNIAASGAKAQLDTEVADIRETYSSKAYLQTKVDEINAVVEQKVSVEQLTEDGGILDQRNYVTQSELNQTSSGINAVIASLTEIVDTNSGDIINTQEKLETYFDFTIDGMNIGKSNNLVRLKLTNDTLSFVKVVNGTETTIASWSATEQSVNTTLQIGNYAFVPRSNGSIDFKKVR